MARGRAKQVMPRPGSVRFAAGNRSTAGKAYPRSSTGMRAIGSAPRFSGKGAKVVSRSMY